MPRGQKGVRMIAVKPSAKAHDQRRMPTAQTKTSAPDTLSMESTITNYCGSDWLDKIESITGTLTFIDVPTYKMAINNIATCEKNIRILFTRLIKQAFGQDLKTLVAVSEEFKRLSTELDINAKAIIRKPTKAARKAHATELNDSNSREDVVDSYVPLMLIKSDWFKSVKLIEREVYRMIEKVMISPDGEMKIGKTAKERKQLAKTYDYSKYDEVLSKYPDLKTLIAPFDIHITSAEIYDTLLGLQKNANIIMNIILTPMYDIKTKITKSFDTKLAPSFKESITNGTLTREVVIDLITDFMVAKYRAMLTGSSKYFVQMLSDELTEGQLAHCDGRNFVEMMDAIDTDTFSKGSRAAGFTTKAKGLMKKMLERSESGQGFDMSILKDVHELVAEKPDEREGLVDVPEAIAKQIAKYDDILPDAPDDTPEEVSEEGKPDEE